MAARLTEDQRSWLVWAAWKGMWVVPPAYWVDACAWAQVVPDISLYRGTLNTDEMGVCSFVHEVHL